MPEYKLIPKQERIIPKYKPAPKGFFWLSFFIFLISLLISGGLLFYKGYLKKQIAVFNSSFEKLKSKIEPTSLAKIVKVASKIESAKKILAGHKKTSFLFEVLEQNTLKNNYWTSFNLKSEESRETGGLFKNRLALKGVSQSYTDLAKQIKIFKMAPYFTEVNFSGFQLLENGAVSYSADLTLQAALFK